jgi:predicted ribosomally synthesized peptide with nif11-like leader
MPINKNELAQEMIQKALQCNTAEDLIAYAKSEGLDITKDEAEAYMAELVDYDLDEEKLQAIAGGTGPYDAPQRPKRIE